MRQRISESIFNDTKVEDKNEIYKKFAFQFSNLFNTGETAKNNEDFEKMYIADIEFEEAINNFLRSINSTAQFCIGYTGIGKTTSLRHCFNLGVSTAPVLTTSSKITKDKYMVIFPTFLDGYMQSSSNYFDLPGRVSAVCTVLEKAHPELQEICNSFDGRRELYEFILEHTPHILETGASLWELEKSSEEDRIIKRLDNGMKYYPLEYCACKLKFYILKKYDRYDRLVIILDDVESLPEDFQEHIIADYFRLFSCMQNTIYPEDSNYRVNLMISLRPHTYRIFFNGMRGRMLAAYPLETPIIKSHAVDLTSLFQNRFDYYTSMSPKVIGNLESWNVCYEQLMLINQAFDSRYKNMISNLSFMNVRASLAEYAKIFTNRFWVQHIHADSGAFSVFPHELTINNVTVIRALGCGNSKIFTGEYNPIIPNFFSPHMIWIIVFSVY